MSRLSRSIFLLLFAATFASVQGAEIRLTPGASVKDRPVQNAVENAAPGDVLILAAGVYREKVTIDKALTLRGESGAVFEGSTPLSAEWTPAGGDLPNVWILKSEKRPAGLLQDGKFIAELRFDRAQKDNDWSWKTLMRKGAPLSGFENIRAIWMYHSKEKCLYARFENGASPDKLKLSAVNSEEALLTIAAANVTVEGLTFRGGFRAVAFEKGASKSTVQNCKILSYEDTGIIVTSDASNCVIEKCEITRGALEEWTPSREHDRANYEIWRLHKDVGNYDRIGINLFRAGTGNKVLNNHIYQVFDGVCIGDYESESLDKPLLDPNHGRDTEIAGNVIENTRDSGIELGVGCIDVNVHHNSLRRTHGGFRFKAPRIGPVFIHHNLLVNGSPFNFWFSMDSSPAEGYIYHNTVVGGAGVEFLLSKSKRDFAAKNWHFMNNLFLTPKGFLQLQGKNPPVDFTMAHNVSSGSRGDLPEDFAKDEKSLYEANVIVDEKGIPAADSVAIDAGLDLSAYRNGKALPGAEAGTFKGKAPDAGAVEVK